jgi:hypothetical protein
MTEVTAEDYIKRVETLGEDAAAMAKAYSKPSDAYTPAGMEYEARKARAYLAEIEIWFGKMRPLVATQIELEKRVEFMPLQMVHDDEDFKAWIIAAEIAVTRLRRLLDVIGSASHE